MKQGIFTIESNEPIADKTYRLELSGDASAFTKPGQFANIKLDGFFLRRPISVSDFTQGGMSLIYKVVGAGTEYMASLQKGAELDILTGLGNGFDVDKSGDSPLLIAGGGGVPPMIRLAKELIKKGCNVTAVLGFNRACEIYGVKELESIGVKVITATIDGSSGVKGFVTDAIKTLKYSFFYACGPLPMYKAVRKVIASRGQYSLEERMGCGFGACMGCSVMMKSGARRICKDGPVFDSEEIVWENL